MLNKLTCNVLILNLFVIFLLLIFQTTLRTVTLQASLMTVIFIHIHSNTFPEVSSKKHSSHISGVNETLIRVIPALP